MRLIIALSLITIFSSCALNLDKGLKLKKPEDHVRKPTSLDNSAHKPKKIQAPREAAFTKFL